MGRLLHELFDEGMARDPGHAALESPEAGLVQRSYRDLHRLAEALRSQLPSFDQPDQLVAIHLPKGSADVPVAQLAVLRSGAAFTCLEPGLPDEHLRHVLADCGARVVITDGEGQAQLRRLGVELTFVLCASEGREDALPAPPHRVDDRDLAYVIYTSGTTGRPKGVAIEHRSIVHLLEAEQRHFELRPRDRCLQVSSNAYDSALEELWLPLYAGATVVLATEELTRLGPDLVPWLREQRISVLMPTPTLLQSTGCEDPQRALPDLRLIYAGGEALPRELADRWARGRRLENGYGPTECTITVTRGGVQPGRQITIGQPIGDARAHVLDDGLKELPDGQPGELCISGPCLARGYLGQPELTRERFVMHPRLGRLYRTGDLVHRDASGDLHYHGRIDSQVKLRGHRIELGQIEAALLEQPGVHEAACTVQGEGAAARLVAFIVREAGAEPVIEELHAALAARLPEPMRPQHIGEIAALPRTVGGKLDRRRLPESGRVGERGTDLELPEDPRRAATWRAFAKVLPAGPFTADDDFFALGGNSLLAAELISALRRDPAFVGIAVRDVYEAPTVAGLAECGVGDELDAPAVPELSLLSGPARTLLVTLLQALWIVAMIGYGSFLAWIVAYVVLPWLLGIFGLVPLLLVSPLLGWFTLALYVPYSVLVAKLAKRVLIGRYEEGRIKVWSFLYLRHWIVVRFAGLVPFGLVRGTIWHGYALRLLGSQVGERVHIHRGVDLRAGGWDLLELGDDVTLSQDAALGVAEYIGQELVLRRVRIGARSILDVRAGVEGGAELGENVRVQALSSVREGERVPSGSLVDGVPAVRLGEAVAADVRSPDMDPRLHGILMIVCASLVGIVLSLPSFTLLLGLLIGFEIDADIALAWIYEPSSSLLVCGLALLFGVFGLLSALLVAALLLRLGRSVPAGRYGRFSGTYVRIWLRSALVAGAGNWLSGSLYWRWWLRLAGMRMGRNCEVSTIIDVLPERVSIGDESFLADGIYLGGARVARGEAQVGETRIGVRSFLGNHVVVPTGEQLAGDMLVGVSTRVDGARMREGSSWFGHPPFELPRRELAEMDRSVTHEPPLHLYLQRLAWESMRFLLPALLAVLALLWFELVTPKGILFAPLVTIGAGLCLLLVVLALKWLLLGRVRPGQHGLWSGWCQRWDFLYMAWGMLGRGVLGVFEGTLLLAWYLRAMGMRIGRRVVLAGSFAQVVDPDMLELRDESCVEPLFQAHTFEDRVLKIGRVRIGEGATVRRGSVLFYGAELGQGCQVAPHSVVMKNERLLPGRHYRGCPTRPDSSGAREL